MKLDLEWDARTLVCDEDSSITPLLSIAELKNSFLSPMFDGLVNKSSKDLSRDLKQILELEELPVEILIIIAMKAGFRSALKLRQTNSFFYSLLSNPLNWSHYARHSQDALEIMISITTRLHTFDNLLFGSWNPPSHSRPCLFYLHKTFLEQYDFLGGVSLYMHGNGLVDVEFFELHHRLPCYEQDLLKRIQDGDLPNLLAAQTTRQAEQRREINALLTQVWEEREIRMNQGPESPLVATPVHPTLRRERPLLLGGLSISHTCPDCEHYDTMTVVDSKLVMDRDARHGQQKFEYSHAFEQSLSIENSICSSLVDTLVQVPTESIFKSLSLKIRPEHRRTALGDDSDLPMITTNIPIINGSELSQLEYHLFRTLVQRR